MCYTYDKSKGGDTRELQSRMVPPQKTGSSHLKCVHTWHGGCLLICVRRRVRIVGSSLDFLVALQSQSGSALSGTGGALL